MKFEVFDKRTGKLADLPEIALNEDWAKDLVYCDMEGFAILQDGTLILLDECGTYRCPPDPERFEIRWAAETAADLPTCAGCGTLMMPSGTCFKCPNCGETSGCS